MLTDFRAEWQQSQRARDREHCELIQHANKFVTIVRLSQDSVVSSGGPMKRCTSSHQVNLFRPRPPDLQYEQRNI